MAESVFKENLFEGKKVFITGGATGMGLGFAQAFLCLLYTSDAADE